MVFVSDGCNWMARATRCATNRPSKWIKTGLGSSGTGKWGTALEPIILIGALVVSVLCSLFYLAFVQLAPPSGAKTMGKCGANGLLCVASLALEGPLALSIALLLFTFADGITTVNRSKRLLGYAMLSGALAQVSVAVLFWTNWSGLRLNQTEGAIVVIGAYGFGMLTLLWPKLGGLRSMTIVYLAIVAWALFLAMGLAEEHGLAVVGMVLFTLSTSVHAVEQFFLEPPNPLIRWTAPVIWVSHHSFTLCLTLAFILPLIAPRF